MTVVSIGAKEEQKGEEDTEKERESQKNRFVKERES